MPSLNYVPSDVYFNEMLDKVRSNLESLKKND